MSRRKNINNLIDYTFTVNDYVQMFRDVALNRIKHIDAPEGIDTRYLELQLLNNGRAIAFKNDGSGEFPESSYPFLSLQLAGSFDVDAYGEPFSRMANGIRSTYTGLTPENSVIFYNNKSRRSELPMIRWYAERMYNTSQICDNNIALQRFSLLAKSPPKARLSFLNAIKNWQMGEPVIPTFDNGLSSTDFELMTPQVPYLADKLQLQTEKLWNECLMRLGVQSFSESKKERYTTDEVENITRVISLYKANILSERQRSCDKFNEIFGTNWRVEWEEGDEIEQLHNDFETGIDDQGI